MTKTKDNTETNQTKETKQTLKSLPEVMGSTVMHSTKYCDLLKQCKIDGEHDEEYFALEEIYIKDKERKELRFAYYHRMMDRSCSKRDFRLVPRCTDMTQLQFIQLIKKALETDFFSDEMVQYLRNALKP